MKPLLAILSILVSSWVVCFGQDCDWDVYSPEKYTPPDKYVPLTTDRPKTITPYRAKRVTGTLDEL